MTYKDFKISLSIDNQKLKQRFFNKHPSESLEYFVTKIIAYALNYDDQLQLAEQICHGEMPLLFIEKDNGYKLWIDINLPSSKRITHALKKSDSIKLYLTKNMPQVSQYLSKSEKVAAFRIDFDWLKFEQEMKSSSLQWNIQIDKDMIRVNEINGKITTISN